MNKTTVELVHFGHQCPWTDVTAENLRRNATEAACPFQATDVQLCGAENVPEISFPFNTYVDGTFVTGSPVHSGDSLESLFPRKDVCDVPKSPELPVGTLSSIERLTPELIDESIHVCCNGGRSIGQKHAWYLENSSRYEGLIGLVSGEPKAILEFMPSELCPYPAVPRDDKALAIVCLYSNDDHVDYRRPLVQRFLDDAAQRGGERAYVISGENGHYPNGTLTFFLGVGFGIVKALGRTWIKGQGFDNIFLLERRL